MPGQERLPLPSPTGPNRFRRPATLRNRRRAGGACLPEEGASPAPDGGRPASWAASPGAEATAGRRSRAVSAPGGAPASRAPGKPEPPTGRILRPARRPVPAGAAPTRPCPTRRAGPGGQGPSAAPARRIGRGGKSRRPWIRGCTRQTTARSVVQNPTSSPPSAATNIMPGPAPDRLSLGPARFSATLFGRAFGLATDGLAHLRIRDDVAHAVIVHDAQVAFPQRGRQRRGHFRFGFHDPGPHLFHHGPHFLFPGEGRKAPFRGLGLGDVFVRFGLVRLQL